MFVVLLKFAENKERAGEFMDGHKAWIARGFEDGVFLLVGSLKSSGGRWRLGTRHFAVRSSGAGGRGSVRCAARCDGRDYRDCAGPR